MIGRVSTFSQTLYLLDRSLGNQARLAEVQAQTASGRKSDSFAGYGSTTGAIARHQADILAADAEAANATSALNLVQQSYSALGAISDLTDTMLSALATYDEDAETLSALSSGWLDDLESLLNGAYGDQALFAGDALSGLAVDLDAWDADDAQAYYKGASEARAFVTADGQNLDISVTAADPVLRGLIDTLKGLADASLSSDDALDATKAAAAGVGVLRTSLSASASRLERIAEQATSKSTAMTAVVSIMKDADLAAVAVVATQYETLLQTSYSTLNMLMSVKLSDYLR